MKYRRKEDLRRRKEDSGGSAEAAPLRRSITIGNVAASDPSVSEGFAPLVRTCDDFRDALGHLTTEGAIAAGKAAGSCYANLRP